MEDCGRVLELAVRAGEILLGNGAEIFRVQETMARIAKAFGAPVFHVYVVSNGIFASVEADGAVYGTRIRYVPLAPVHLGRVAAVNDLSRGIAKGKYTLEGAFARLDEIRRLPFSPAPLQILASAVGSACFCYIFGGTWRDSLTAALSGGLLYVFLLLVQDRGISKIVVNILASALVTLCGLGFWGLGLGMHMDKIIIGSIIPLLPGVPLTTSIRDFLGGDYLSGTIHLTDALLIAGSIAIGVGFVLKVYSLLAGGAAWAL